MRIVLIVVACVGLAFLGCRKRKVEAVPVPTNSDTTAPQPAAAPAAVSAANPPKPQLTPAQAEASVEFGDLNNLIAGFENKNKRLPTVEELKRLYYGGTKPIPVPPGYRLVIDPKTKTAKAVSGN